VLIANNLFVIAGASRVVAGDQSKPDQLTAGDLGRVVVSHNLFLRPDNWPAELRLTDAAPTYGDPAFPRPGGLKLEDYVPGARDLVRDRGIAIPALPGDPIGLTVGLEVPADILGRPILGAPDLGAIELP
jgi:hypothetical protein